MRIPWKSNEHGIAFISCISYISCITGVQDRGFLIQTWYSHQTHRLDLPLLCAQRLAMEQLCGVTKRKARLGLSMKMCLMLICFHDGFICNWLSSVLWGC